MHFENVKKLTASTEESVKNAGYEMYKYIVTSSYFSMNIQSNQVLLKQTAVIRTNCIDCLDRMMNNEYGLYVGTNVVQSEYAKEMIFNQLFKEKGKEIMNECLYVQ